MLSFNNRSCRSNVQKMIHTTHNRRNKRGLVPQSCTCLSSEYKSTREDNRVSSRAFNVNEDLHLLTPSAMSVRRGNLWEIQSLLIKSNLVLYYLYMILQKTASACHSERFTCLFDRYKNITAVKWLIIQNKSFCLQWYMCTVYIYYVYINTHTCMYI